jgi:hypothetical protein
MLLLHGAPIDPAPVGAFPVEGAFLLEALAIPVRELAGGAARRHLDAELVPGEPRAGQQRQPGVPLAAAAAQTRSTASFPSPEWHASQTKCPAPQRARLGRTAPHPAQAIASDVAR